MLEVGWFSTKLMLKGKLLRNPGYFFRQAAIGGAIALLLLIGMVKTGIGLWLPVMVSSLVTGIIMPFLLKDVKLQ